MTNAERIIGVLRRQPGLSDAQLRQATGIKPHQQVNQICRRLAAEGVLCRRRGPDGRIENRLAEGALTEPGRADPSLLTATPAVGDIALGRTDVPDAVPLASSSDALIVIPCCGAKRQGGTSGADGRRISDVLPPELAQRLFEARRAIAREMDIDETRLLPASQRYDGSLYDAASASLRELNRSAWPYVILSGGYGVVLGTEPIAWYDRRFKTTDWPRGLLGPPLLSVSPGAK